jgi:Na+/H+ antiporter NhaD/arsenite permease-like protein
MTLLILLLVIVGISLFLGHQPTIASDENPVNFMRGYVFDKQGQPVRGAAINVYSGEGDNIFVSTETQEDGSFVVELTGELLTKLNLEIERPHFKSMTLSFNSSDLKKLNSEQPLIIPDIFLERKVNASFWIATIIFIGMLFLIASGVIHNTLAALVGTSLLFIISYLGHPLNEDLFIFDFDKAMAYVDWNVIFLIMGMMMVIAVIERTGIFQWLAFFAYRISRGKTWILLAILMVITGIASAFLDNVTTMLLMAPITIQIALAMGINPLALIIPEVFASNVVGVSTLIGTPTNILIGSFGDISFMDFLSNQTFGVILALLGLIIYCELVFKKDLKINQENGVSDLLLIKLGERAKITEPKNLLKAAFIGTGMLILFIFGEQIHLIPSVTAIIGATALLVWIRPNIEEMIEAVDWTTLVFFMGLFIVVGSIQEVGLISLIAEFVGSLVSGNLFLAVIATAFLAAILSMAVDNIPFTAAMLPVIGYLTTTIPGAESKVLYFCLSVGAAMGGNGSLIGSSPNLVAAGISERAGYPVSYMYFLKKGFPALLITVTLATLWLLFRFF